MWWLLLLLGLGLRQLGLLLLDDYDDGLLLGVGRLLQHSTTANLHLLLQLHLRHGCSWVVAIASRHDRVPCWALGCSQGC